MNSETIPEAREAADSWDNRLGKPATTLPLLISEACLAYHKRRLAECGGDAREAAKKLQPVRVMTGMGTDVSYPSEDEIVELIQLHTAKAVEEATEKLKEERNKAAMLERRKYLPKLEALQKQCEELQERLDRCGPESFRLERDGFEKELEYIDAKVIRRGDHSTLEAVDRVVKERDELLAGKEKVLTTAAYQEHIGQELLELKKERDELRTKMHGIASAIGALHTRAEKAEAEVVELKKKLNEMVQADPRQLWNVATFEMKDQLTQLQQDVRPLVNCLTILAGGKHGEEPGSALLSEIALEVFLTKHPELSKE